MNQVLSTMYAPNDRLGVELMGAIKWNALKKAVSQLSRNAVKNATGGVNTFNKAVNAFNRSRSVNPLTRARLVTRLNGTLCGELLRPNEDFCSELLGANIWERAWDGIQDMTHNVLEFGEDKPFLKEAVSSFRDFTSALTGGKKAVDVATTAYDNRGKIILGGVGLALLLYFLLRKKK